MFSLRGYSAAAIQRTISTKPGSGLLLRTRTNLAPGDCWGGGAGSGACCSQMRSVHEFRQSLKLANSATTIDSDSTNPRTGPWCFAPWSRKLSFQMIYLIYLYLLLALTSPCFCESEPVPGGFAGLLQQLLSGVHITWQLFERRLMPHLTL